MERFDDDVKPSVCEQLGDKPGITRRQDPSRLVLRLRGQGAPIVQDYAGPENLMAWVIQEGMMGLRDGDVITLYALDWRAQGWGRA
jgi:hypothetical protein